MTIVTSPIPCIGKGPENISDDFLDVKLTKVYNDENVTYVVLAGEVGRVRDFLTTYFVSIKEDAEYGYNFDEIIWHSVEVSYSL